MFFVNMTDEEFCKAARAIQPKDGSPFDLTILRLEHALDNEVELRRTIDRLKREASNRGVY